MQSCESEMFSFFKRKGKLDLDLCCCLNYRVNTNYSHNVLCYFSFCVQFKKSGKEPKAAAELVFGNTTYKSKVLV